MRLSSPYLFLPLLPAAHAALNGHCTGSAATGAWKDYGICVKTSTCNSFKGAYKSGACPNDPDDVKCCVVGIGDNSGENPCGGVSYCEWTSDTCNGVFKSSTCRTIPPSSSSSPEMMLLLTWHHSNSQIIALVAPTTSVARFPEALEMLLPVHPFDIYI